MRWIYLAVAFATSPAFAQSLAEAFEAAWQRHPQARAAAMRDAGLAATVEAAASLAPHPAAVSVGKLSDRLGRKHGKDEWEVELAVPMWLPGQRAARRGLAEDERQLAAAQLAAARLELAGQLREAWWQLPAARAVEDLAARRLDTARGLEADVARRHRAGDLAQVDANLARDERLAAEAALAEAALARGEAEQALLRLTGRTPPAAPGEEGEAPAPATHPRLQLGLAAREAARSRLRLAEASRREAPEVSLRLVRERGEAAEAYANSVGVRLRIPFASDARSRAADSGARAELEASDAELLLARELIERALAQDAARLDAARAAQVRAAERRRLMADNLRLAERAFELGELDLTQLLRVRERAFEAELALRLAGNGVAAARSRLNQSLGAMPR